MYFVPKYFASTGCRNSRTPYSVTSPIFPPWAAKAVIDEPISTKEHSIQCSVVSNVLYLIHCQSQNNASWAQIIHRLDKIVIAYISSLGLLLTLSLRSNG